jgi:type IV pilus assembly protein PilV
MLTRMKNRLQLISSGQIQSPGRSKQSGVALLETLLAMLVFSLGILTVVAIQAASVKMSADAQLRTRAVLLADQLVGTMWVSGEKIADLQTKFQTGGEGYNEWAESVSAALPGVSLDGDTKPTVVIISDPDAERNGEVTITLYWRTPNMKDGDDSRQHVVISQITRNL